MVRAWYMDDDETSDKRLEHQKSPPEFLSLDELRKLTGVEHFKLNLKTHATDGVYDEIKKKRGYTYEDELICSKECLENYDEKLKTFYTEHLHTEEEIRFILEGCGYFDVRDAEDKWIRIEVVGGDMLVLPSGSYHRFTLNTDNYLKAKRLFIGQPDWIAHNRPQDNLDCRKKFLEKLKQ